MSAVLLKRALWLANNYKNFVIGQQISVKIK